MDLNSLKRLIAAGATTAQRLAASDMSVNSLRTNALLRQDDWKALDKSVQDVAQKRYVGVADLLGRGQRLTIPNGLGKMMLESENVSDMRDAELNMSGVTRGQNDTVNYEVVGVPLPLTHKDYELDIRRLTASRNSGTPLDSTQARLATKKVANYGEALLFNGSSSFAYADYVIYGYLDFPSINSRSMGTDWASDTGANILTDVLAAKQLSITAMHFGPWFMYLPTNFDTTMDQDYSTAKGSNTVGERILAVTGIEQLKVADVLTASNVVLVQMDSDVVRMVEGLPMTNVEWDQMGGMIQNMKIMTIMVPEIRADQDGNCGVTVIA